MKNLVCLFILINLSLKAQIIYYSDISTYQSGQNLVGQNNWQEVSYLSLNSTQTQVVNFPMNFSNYSSTDKAIQYLPGQNTTSISFSNNTTTTSANYYFAFLINVQNVNIGHEITTYDFLRIYSSNDFIYRIMAFGSGNGYQLRFGKMNTEVCPTVLNFNQTYLLIFKYSQNSGNLVDDTISLFINPNINLSEPTPDVTTSLGTDVNSILAVNKIILSQDLSSYNNFSAYFSQPKLTMSWQDFANHELAIDEKNSSTKQFIIAQNPVKNNILKIKYFQKTENSKFSINIYDFSGKKVMSNVDIDKDIDISNLNAGKYFVQISNQNGEILSFLKTN